jgi:hypothetical protein
MSNDVHHQEKRLRRIFGRALLVALATPVAVPLACSSGGNPDATGRGGSGTGAASNGAAPASSTGGAAPSTSGGATATNGGTTTMTSSGAATTSSGTTTATSSGTTTATGSTSGGDASAPEEDAGVDCGSYVFEPTPEDGCGTYVRLPCGLPEGVTPGTNCYLFLTDCAKLCPTNSFFNCHATGQSCTDAGAIVTDPAGGIDLDCSICANGVGRIPAGLARARMAAAPSALGNYFAAAAHFEQASVHAFQRLSAELAAHRAPARLLRAARRAERDEVRHARLMGRMAARFGGRPVRPRVCAGRPRALSTVAIENAMEGCVRETFGALVASFQAENAGDPAVARLMTSVARDETRHAALSWSVARWASRRIDAASRVGLAARCRDVIHALRRESRARVDDDLRARAGLPTTSQRLALLDALEAQLWDGAFGLAESAPEDAGMQAAAA